MSSSVSTNKRIAKNTILLYFRMLLIMAVSLYTSRVILRVLGVEDFGLYNIIGGVVVLFSFLNNAMSNATQRFLSYEIGRKDLIQLRKTFCMSINAHIIIALILIVLAETIGLWFVNNYLNIPADRIVAAKWVYQFSILTFIFNILRVPYNATIIAHERMSFYAYISIIESLLKLGIVYILTLGDSDKLILYAILISIVAFVVNIVYIFYCSRTFESSKYTLFWDKNLLGKLMRFSGWSMFGSFASIGAIQGTNILINIFKGVALNAAFGIANQASNAIYSLISGFQVAYNPQIVKMYARNEKENLWKFIFQVSKFSYFLFFSIAIPVLFKMDFILGLWLDKVPQYTVEFCQLMIVYFLFDALQAPIWMLVYATGNIKKYQIYVSLITLTVLPISFICLYLGFSPVIVLVLRVITNIFCSIFRMMLVRKMIDFPSFTYCKVVLTRVFSVTLLSFLTLIFINHIFPTTLIYKWVFIIISPFTIILISFFAGFNLIDRMSLIVKLKTFFTNDSENNSIQE